MKTSLVRAVSRKMGFTDILGGIISYILDHPTILAVGILLYIFIFALSIFLSGPKPGPNPFVKDKSQPPRPIVIDQKVRDQVIKQGRLMKHIDCFLSLRWDVVQSS